jgi:hypothetical protein
VKVPGANNMKYRGRKQTTTQNVMCVTDMDLCFTFVYAGWEGSAHDSRIFAMCVNDPTLRFPKPKEGIMTNKKIIMCNVGYAILVIVVCDNCFSIFMCGAGFFYLVDSGYGCYKGFLPPFRRERYHLQTFQHGQELPRTMRELFNYRHSSLRSVVERSFAVLKNRFPILYLMPPYLVRYQRLFVIACCTLHNFIRKYSGTEDPYFKEALMRLNPWVDEDDRQERDMASNVSPGERPDQSEASSIFMGQVRDAMAISMWNLSNGM